MCFSLIKVKHFLSSLDVQKNDDIWTSAISSAPLEECYRSEGKKTLFKVFFGNHELCLDLLIWYTYCTKLIKCGQDANNTLFLEKE
jgi:hypothetical protein